MALKRKKLLEKEIANTENIRYNLELQVGKGSPLNPYLFHVVRLSHLRMQTQVHKQWTPFEEETNS